MLILLVVSYITKKPLSNDSSKREVNRVVGKVCRKMKVIAEIVAVALSVVQPHTIMTKYCALFLVYTIAGRTAIFFTYYSI
jgi:predicted DNA repair protein MutK